MLTFSHGKILHRKERIQVKSKEVAEFMKLFAMDVFVSAKPPYTTNHEIVEDRELREIEWVLIEHPDPKLARLGGSSIFNSAPVEEYTSLALAHISGKDLHQRALAGAILPKDAVDRPGGDLHAYAVICAQMPVVFVDVP